MKRLSLFLIIFSAVMTPPPPAYAADFDIPSAVSNLYSHVTNTYTNPFITSVTGIKPGSVQAQQAGRTIAQWTGGIVNVPVKLMFGKDLSNPGKETVNGLNRITSITPWEAVTYGAFIAAPLIPGAVSAAGTAAADPDIVPFITMASKAATVIKEGAETVGALFVLHEINVGLNSNDSWTGQVLKAIDKHTNIIPPVIHIGGFTITKIPQKNTGRIR
jgi:hypothetical protein